MRVTVVLEAHFSYDNAGLFHAAAFDTDFWDRYLEVFSGVDVLARATDTSEVAREPHPGHAHEVELWPLPPYRGLGGLLFALPRLVQRSWVRIRKADALILRVPGALGTLAAIIARIQGKPFSLEVVGDPWDSLKTLQFPGRTAIRVLAAAALRWSVRNAQAVSYVTQQKIQRRYAPSPGKPTFNYSSITLPQSWISSPNNERKARLSECAQGSRSWQLGFIGTFNVMYKAPEVHIKALQTICKDGLDASLHMLGEGRHQQDMADYSKELGLEDRVIFHGQVPPGRAVLDFLDGTDLFLIASRAEGLPRALIEAMARGCPAVGSNVGGIPELLPEESLVPPDSAAYLANKIQELLSNPDRMLREASRNAEKAREFCDDEIAPRREAFYRAVKESAPQP